MTRGSLRSEKKSIARRGLDLAEHVTCAAGPLDRAREGRIFVQRAAEVARRRTFGRIVLHAMAGGIHHQYVRI